MDAHQRERRRQDLLLASELLRQQVDVQLDRVAPTADRAWRAVSLGLWLHRQAAALPGGRSAGLLALGAGLVGGVRIGLFGLRRRRWVRHAFVVWRLWRALRR